jgi:hypothetical protein
MNNKAKIHEYSKDNLGLVSKVNLTLRKPKTIIIFSENFKEISEGLKETFKNLSHKSFEIIDGKNKDSEFLKFLIKKRFSPTIIIPDKEMKLSKDVRGLIESLSQDSSVIYNFDNESLRNGFYRKSSVKFIGFGFQKKSDLKLLEIEDPQSKNLKIDYEGHIVPLKIEKKLKKKELYEVLLLISVADCLGLNLVETSSTIQEKMKNS